MLALLLLKVLLYLAIYVFLIMESSTESDSQTELESLARVISLLQLGLKCWQNTPITTAVGLMVREQHLRSEV